jgi:RNA polymerase sigma factor (sigma-70 family)
MINKREVPLTEINSNTFLERLKARDDRAFSDLITCIVPKLCSFLSKDFGLSDEDGEEIATETMLKVNKSIAKYDPDGGAKLSTWIFRIAKHTAIDFLRRQKRETENPRNSEPFNDIVSKQVAQTTVNQWFRDNSPISSPSVSVKQNEIQRQIEKMKRSLKALSEQDRSLLIMKQSMEYEEIAAVENVSVPTLRTRYSRALERLRQEMQKEDLL